MDRDPIRDATDLVEHLIPHARWALLTGSVMTAHRTAGSDLDIVVRIEDGHPDATYRRSLTWRDWPVELFVYDEPGLERYLASNLAARRPCLPRMIATGVTIAGTDAQTAELRARCQATLAAGPGPLPDKELERARYGLTDLLDDLTHSTDPGETVVLTATVWLAVARLACDIAGHWRGSGKWLVRELRALDPDLAHRWLAAHGNPRAVQTLAREVLAQAADRCSTDTTSQETDMDRDQVVERALSRPWRRS